MAVIAASVQASSLDLLVVEERRALSGWSMSAHFRMKRVVEINESKELTKFAQ